jgi:DNA-directed RNA polymerase II subunit RPB1
MCAELSQIAWVPQQVCSFFFLPQTTHIQLPLLSQIISPQANKPVIMGIVQDTFVVFGSSLRDTFLDWNHVQNILLWVPEWDGAVPIPAIVVW